MNAIIHMHLRVRVEVNCCFCCTDIAGVTPTADVTPVAFYVRFFFYNGYYNNCLFFKVLRFNVVDVSLDEDCRSEDDVASGNDDHINVHPEE